jgi:formate hydrogenlyase transcriptional activator
LQEREFERVGGSTPIKVDVRVIAATNRDLLKAVQEKTFRDDLYYRLNVFPVRLPPLRERRQDIPLLVHFLVNKFKTRIGKQVESVSRQTMDLLLGYAWPGNIRELENVLERAVILARGPVLDIDPGSLAGTPAPASANHSLSSLEEIERGHIVHVLEQTGWVIDGPRGAARILQLHPNTLRSRMKKLRIVRSTQSS